MRRHRRSRAGITLLEAAAVVCVVGVLLAMFIPAFLREVRVSKTSEASENLALLYRRSAAYFAVRRPQREGPTLTQCLPGVAGPTPHQPTVELAHVDFKADTTPGAATWRALDFNGRRTSSTDRGTLVRYAYTFEPTIA